MAILCCEGNISERCKAAGELLAALKRVPTAYMLAISSPLVRTPFAMVGCRNDLPALIITFMAVWNSYITWPASVTC